MSETNRQGAAAEIIFSGDELLRGDTLNTNQAYLGQRLLDLGIFATHALCVADDLQAMVRAIRASLERHPVILVLSGGLGPTDDDLTREAVEEALGRPLEHREDLFELIRARFVSRGMVMGDSNRKQASIPQGATAIPLTGTAPGFHLQQGDTLVVALPGVPWELQQMWEDTVEPLLRARPEGARAAQTVRRIRTFGIGESTLAETLSEFDWHAPAVTIGTRAHLDGVTVILRGPSAAGGGGGLEAVETRIRAILGERVYSLNDESLAEVVGKLLRRIGCTVAVAESCTGGLVGKRITDMPGSSEYFLGGVTAYDNRIKTEVLGVPADVLAVRGAVSMELAAAMAEGVCRLTGADCALSTTGVAGPGGGSDDKPVGLVYIGSVVKSVTSVERLHFPGQREHIRERAAFAALDLLRRRLLQQPPA
ncbi:MAG: competence/damage-inducible protein A [Actinobacteria bacterium]|nr:competence/damage-inducible protein A [Actinomycetota bacterium]